MCNFYLRVLLEGNLQPCLSHFLIVLTTLECRGLALKISVDSACLKNEVEEFTAIIVNFKSPFTIVQYDLASKFNSMFFSLPGRWRTVHLAGSSAGRYYHMHRTGQRQECGGYSVYCRVSGHLPANPRIYFCMFTDNT